MFMAEKGIRAAAQNTSNISDHRKNTKLSKIDKYFTHSIDKL